MISDVFVNGIVLGIEIAVGLGFLFFLHSVWRDLRNAFFE